MTATWKGRPGFDRALGALQDEVLVLGSMVDKAIGRAIEALKRLDQQAARELIEDDIAINRRRYQIEEQAIELIATQQPMARDLRTIVAVVHITVELERMGDYAKGIAEIVLRHGDQPLLKPLIDVPRMADRARDMLRRSLDALIARDAALARQIAAEDDEVDALYDQVYRELLTFMLQDPRTIDRATWLLWTAHNLERIADRATNICERVVYEVTGETSEMNVSTY
jgi:phosphate transport system protein